MAPAESWAVAPSGSSKLHTISPVVCCACKLSARNGWNAIMHPLKQRDATTFFMKGSPFRVDFPPGSDFRHRAEAQGPWRRTGCAGLDSVRPIETKLPHPDATLRPVFELCQSLRTARQTGSC